jgi:hypothetical protein
MSDFSVFSKKMTSLPPNTAETAQPVYIVQKSESSGCFTTFCMIVVALIILVVAGVNEYAKEENAKPVLPVTVSSWYSDSLLNPGGYILLKNTSDRELTVTVSVSGPRDTTTFRAVLPAHSSKEYYGSEISWIFMLGEKVTLTHSDYKTSVTNLVR